MTTTDPTRLKSNVDSLLRVYLEDEINKSEAPGRYDLTFSQAGKMSVTVRVEFTGRFSVIARNGDPALSFDGVRIASLLYRRIFTFIDALKSIGFSERTPETP